MKNLVKKLSGPVQVIALTIFISVAGSYFVQAANDYAEPLCGPVGCNATAPLNVSSAPQSKVGSLIVQGYLADGITQAANGLLVSHGNVGIGTVTPAEKLDVAGDIRAQTGRVYVGMQGPYLAGTSDLVLRTNGGVYIQSIASPNNPANLDVGDVTANKFLYRSDRSLKTNIIPLQDSLSKILQLQGVSFNLKQDGLASLGLIAQDVEKIYPELVITDAETGLKSVEYGKIVAPLIEAIKSQQKEIDQLKAQIKELQNKK